jgi:hypothetical protein
MQALYIVEIDKSVSEYSDKLKQLIGKRSVDAMPCTLEEYQAMNSLSDILGGEAKFIFIGANSSGQSAMPSITSWKYERFGCRIGWNGNTCVIFARDTDLPYSDYKEFRDYCRGEQLEYPDVIIPPESPIAEGFEAVKKFFNDKENKSAHRAQYSTLIHEFMDRCFDEFINSDGDFEDDVEDADVPTGIKDILQNLKATAFAAGAAAAEAAAAGAGAVADGACAVAAGAGALAANAGAAVAEAVAAGAGAVADGAGALAASAGAAVAKAVAARAGAVDDDAGALAASVDAAVAEAGNVTGVAPTAGATPASSAVEES